MLESTSYLSHQLDFNYAGNHPVSLGQALEWIIKLQEKHVKEKQIEFLKNRVALQKKMIDNQELINDTVSLVESLRLKYDNLVKERSTKSFANEQESIEFEFEIRKTNREWQKQWKVLEEYQVTEEELSKELTELEANPPRY